MSATTTPTESTRPCQLQINTSGAWKNIITFDASDDHANNEVLDSASTLATKHASGPATLRIVPASSPNDVLMRWTKAKGWETASHAAH